MLLSGYKKDVAKRRGNSSPQKTPTAPDAIHVLKLGPALEALKEGKTVGKPKMNANYGGGTGNGPERLQIKPKFDSKLGSEIGLTDATVESPILQQLLSIREMNKRKTQ